MVYDYKTHLVIINIGVYVKWNVVVEKCYEDIYNHDCLWHWRHYPFLESNKSFLLDLSESGFEKCTVLGHMSIGVDITKEIVHFLDVTWWFLMKDAENYFFLGLRPVGFN